MRLVYLPESEALFLWATDRAPDAAALEGTPELQALFAAAQPHTTTLVTPEGRRDVAGLLLPLLDSVSALALLPSAVLPALPVSLGCWALASKLALELVARERVVPTL